LAESRDDREYAEWLEAFWARDIMELFRLERRASFLKFAELLLLQSGGRFEASSFTSPCGVSRPTIMKYLGVLEATYLVHVIRPYHGGGANEITATPLVYGIDTGFVVWAQGLHEIPAKERGFYWEHLVLNELMARLQSREILSWRDKRNIHQCAESGRAGQVVRSSVWRHGSTRHRWEGWPPGAASSFPGPRPGEKPCPDHRARCRHRRLFPPAPPPAGPPQANPARCQASPARAARIG
jgi:hypothetical protein